MKMPSKPMQIIKEGSNYPKSEIGDVFEREMEELRDAMASAKLPGAWAEKVPVNGNIVIDKMRELTHVFSKMR